MSLLICFLAGAASALAMPPFDFWWVLFVTVPFLVVRLERKDGGFATGWWFGFGYFCVALHWIGYAFLVDAKTYLWMMPFAVGGLAAVMAVYWGLAGLVAVRLRKLGAPLFLAVPLVLAIAEWLRGHLMTGFPWAAPGLAFDGMGDFIQLAAVVGMPGLTLIILLWAGAAVAFTGTRTLGQKIFALLVLASIVPCWFYGHWRAAQEVGTVAGVELAILQPAISQSDKWRGDNASQIFDQLVRMSAEAHTATHFIWPESAVPFLLDESDGAKSVLRNLLGPKAALVTGAIRRSVPNPDADYFTSILVFNQMAQVTGTYDKWRLVPGGEFLPFAWVLEPLGFQQLVHLPGSFAAGMGPKSLVIPGAGKAAAIICYEAIFPDGLVDENDRPDWILNVTNDGWFGQSTGPYQHFAQVRMRAVEQGLPVVRSANTGISGVIDPYGRIVNMMALGQSGVVKSSLPNGLNATIYSRNGDAMLGALLVSLTVATLVFAFRLR